MKLRQFFPHVVTWGGIIGQVVNVAAGGTFRPRDMAVWAVVLGAWVIIAGWYQHEAGRYRQMWVEARDELGRLVDTRWKA